MASNLASQADVSIVAPLHLPHGSIEQGTTLLRQDGFVLSAHAVRNVDEEDHRRTVDTDAVQNAWHPVSSLAERDQATGERAREFCRHLRLL